MTSIPRRTVNATKLHCLPLVTAFAIASCFAHPLSNRPSVQCQHNFKESQSMKAERVAGRKKCATPVFGPTLSTKHLRQLAGKRRESGTPPSSPEPPSHDSTRQIALAPKLNHQRELKKKDKEGVQGGSVRGVVRGVDKLHCFL